MTNLTASRLTLRPLARSDAPDLLPVFSDAETMRYWAHAPIATIAEMDEKLVANMTPLGPSLGFAIAETRDGPAMGWAVFYGLKNRIAGAGYILGKAHRGKGYATEAMRALMAYGFATLNLHRIFLDIDPDNAPSIRLAERCGFRKEGHFKQNFHRDGQYYDSVYYALLAEEWFK
jgi:ribosomal-protein-alanine N-acetyltransferase